MKIWELDLEEGKQYEIINKVDENLFGIIFVVNTFGDLVTPKQTDLTSVCSLNNLMKLEFEEVVDWSKITVDTKVLVSDDGENWHKGYFKQYKNGVFCCFSDGRTSWTSIFNKEYKYCKLAEI